MKIPTLDQLLTTAMHTVIRRLIWNIPKKYFWTVVLATIVISGFATFRTLFWSLLG